MSAISEVWTVRKGVTDYKVSPTGSNVIYRPNGFSEAVMTFDNSDGLVTNIFVEEDAVKVKIGSTVMLDGFIASLSSKQMPSRANEIRLRIVDYGGYLAGKSVFEKEYKRIATCEDVLADASQEVLGITTNITGLGTVNEEIKRQFLGTYARDAWYYAVEFGGGDYFVDENLVLQAFARETRDLEFSVSNQYRIRDIAPSLSRDLIVDHRYPYSFEKDVTQRFRKVIVTTGVLETYPPKIDELQQTNQKDDHRGKDYSIYFNTIIDDYDIATTEIEPARFEGAVAVDSGNKMTMPTIKILSPDTGTNMSLNVKPITRDNTGSDFVLEDFNVDLLDYQRIGFFIKNGLTGATVTGVTLVLTCGGGFWTRSILPDMVSGETSGGTGFVYIEYPLPTVLGQDSNGWTNALTNDGVLKSMQFSITPSTGYTAESFLELGKLHLFRRRRGSDSVGGSPATEKIIVDSRQLGQESLDTLAVKELARANVVANKGSFTIAGNKDFTKPAYMLEVDFTQTLGSAYSGQVRMKEIRHFLQQGVHYTTVFFNNSFQRL